MFVLVTVETHFVTSNIKDSIIIMRYQKIIKKVKITDIFQIDLFRNLEIRKRKEKFPVSQIF